MIAEIVFRDGRLRGSDSLMPAAYTTAVSQNVQPGSMALRRTGSACLNVRLVPRPKDRPMAPNPGLLTLRPDEPKGSVLTMMGRIEMNRIWMR